MNRPADQAIATPPRSVAIVGNAPDMGDQGSAIDAADRVVRFNNASGFGGRAGRRVTHLALVNHGGQMREWLADPGFLDRPVVRAAKGFLFPFPRKNGAVQDEDGRDWTSEASERLAPLGARITVLRPGLHREALAILGVSRMAAPAPSTGFLVALHLLRRFGPEVAIGVHGFGFAGWSGHDWDGERRWFERMAEEGRLRLHPPTERLS